jgi:hypothetical protein
VQRKALPLHHKHPVSQLSVLHQLAVVPQQLCDLLSFMIKLLSFPQQLFDLLNFLLEGFLGGVEGGGAARLACTRCMSEG